MIQFHCFTYARHFLSNCSALLGLEYQPARGGLLHLNYNGHHVHVRACHVGIDADTVISRLQVDNVVYCICVQVCVCVCVLVCTLKSPFGTCNLVLSTQIYCVCAVCSFTFARVCMCVCVCLRTCKKENSGPS
jgi:hypothetical protein